MEENKRLQHDMSFLMARRLVGIILNCLREEEYQDCVTAFAEIVREGLVEYERRAGRQWQRLHGGPFQN